MKTFVAAAGLAAALALSAGSAQAGGHVNWSIGIDLPPVGAVISNGPSYRADYAPVYSSGYGPGYGAVVVPAPVYAAPPVVYYRPLPPVYYAPRLAYGGYAPSPVVYGSPYRRWHDDRGGEWRDGRDGGRWDGRQPRDERRYRH